jgi:hypothetical protein
VTAPGIASPIHFLQEITFQKESGGIPMGSRRFEFVIKF